MIHLCIYAKEIMMIIEQHGDLTTCMTPANYIYEKLYQDNGDGTAVLVSTPGQLQCPLPLLCSLVMTPVGSRALSCSHIG